MISTLVSHNKEFVWQARGYSSVYEMNEDFIKKWNDTVDQDDEVYVLGDLALGEESNIDYYTQLKGLIHVVRGNHDSDNRALKYETLDNIVDVQWATMVNYKKFHFFMTHFPCMTSNYDDGRGLTHRTWSLCGHVHTSDKYLEMRKGLACYHVEVDAHNGKPISLDEVIDDIRSFYNNSLVQK